MPSYNNLWNEMQNKTLKENPILLWCICRMQDAIGMVGDGRRLKLFGTLFSLTWFSQPLSHKFHSKIPPSIRIPVPPISCPPTFVPLQGWSAPTFIEAGEEHIWQKGSNWAWWAQSFQSRSFECLKLQRSTLNIGISAFNDHPRHNFQNKGIFPY